MYAPFFICSYATYCFNLMNQEEGDILGIEEVAKS